MKHDTKECIKLHRRLPNWVESIHARRSRDETTSGHTGTSSFRTEATIKAMNPEKRMAQFEAGASPNMSAMSAMIEGPEVLTQVRRCVAHEAGNVWN